jgi:NAD(P)-dependent dehydrogenase (short-subunit alcohol dehydrogenase family)
MRSVLLTGAAGGIGQETVLHFVGQGDNVIACDRDADGLSRLVMAAGKDGRFITPVIIDLLNLDSLSQAEDIVARHGTLDVLVNCAGICSPTPLDVITPEEWDRTYAINVRGPFFLTQRLLPYLRKGSSPCIVNVSSLAGFTGGIQSSPAYSSSKAAVTCTTKSLAKFCAPIGIRVNEVSPGTTLTQMTINSFGEASVPGFISRVPLGRLANTQDIAKVIIFLASDQAGFITGQSLQVNGGMYIP